MVSELGGFTVKYSLYSVTDAGVHLHPHLCSHSHVTDI